MKEIHDLKEFEDKTFNLNNFETILPDDQPPEIPGEPKIRASQRRQLSYEAGLLDRRPPVEKMTLPERSLRSPVYLNQTYRDFFRTVDAAIAALGLGSVVGEYFEAKRKITFPGVRDKIKDLAAEAALKQRRTLKRQFYADVMPLYVYLRKKGYSWYDLTG